MKEIAKIEGVAVGCGAERLSNEGGVRTKLGGAGRQAWL